MIQLTDTIVATIHSVIGNFESTLAYARGSVTGCGWQRSSNVRKTEIRVESVKAFFERGRKIARALDRGERIRSSRVISFEDVSSLLHVLTAKRVLLLKQVRETPGSISSLAKKLNRDRSAVTRDIQVLERFGVVEVTKKALPGHGMQKCAFVIARGPRRPG